MNNTMNKIKKVLDDYSERYDNQVNLGSSYVRLDLAELIYNTVMKRDQPSPIETTNQQQLEYFTNNTDEEHK